VTARRKWLWITGVVSSVLLIALTVIDFELKATGGPGIVAFEVAGTTDRANEILAEWGEDGRDWARLSLWLDFPYLIAYGAFFALAVAALRDAGRDRGWHRYARAGSLLVLAPIAAALFDAVEDVALLLVVDGHADSPAPAIATAFALVKFLALGVTILYLLAGLATIGRERLRDRRAPSPGDPA
jgi:hypothetical protein